MRLRRPLPAVQGDTLHIVGVGDNRIGKEYPRTTYFMPSPVTTLIFLIIRLDAEVFVEQQLGD